MQPREFTESHQDRPGLATPAEAARFLKLSRSMIFRLIAQQEIPTRRYGRAVRIPWNWLRNQSADSERQKREDNRGGAR